YCRGVSELEALFGPRPAFAAGAPFGIGEIKPRDYRAILSAIWDNKDQLARFWRLLTEGACDACALGSAGLHDWTHSADQVHLCERRVASMRDRLMPMMADAETLLADVDALRRLSSRAEFLQLGRIPFPMRRRVGERGFRRVSWDEAFLEIGESLAR